MGAAVGRLACPSLTFIGPVYGSAAQVTRRAPPVGTRLVVLTGALSSPRPRSVLEAPGVPLATAAVAPIGPAVEDARSAASSATFVKVAVAVVHATVRVSLARTVSAFILAPITPPAVIEALTGPLACTQGGHYQLVRAAGPPAAECP